MSIQKAISGTFLANLIFLACSFITSIFTARFLGPEGRGVFAILQANVNLLSLVLSFSLTGGIVYYISNNKIAYEKILGGSIIVFFLSTILAIIILFLLNFFGWEGILFPAGYTSNYYYLYVLLAFLVTFIYSIGQALARAEKIFDLINYVQVFNGVVLLVFFVWAYFFISKEEYITVKLDYALWGALGITFVGLILIFFFYIKQFYSKIKVSFQLKGVLSVAFPYLSTGLMADFLNFINYRIDLWVVEYFKGVYDLGLYSLAVTNGQTLWIVPSAVSIVLLPFLNSKEYEKNKESVFLFFVKLNFLTIFLIAFIGFLLSPWLFPIIYGAEFSGAVNPFRLILGGIIFSGLTKVIAMYFVVLGKFSWNVISVFWGAMATIVFDLLLIPAFGINGASIATSISYGITFFVLYYYLIIRTNFKHKNLFFMTIKEFQQNKKYLQFK